MMTAKARIVRLVAGGTGFCTGLMFFSVMATLTAIPFASVFLSLHWQIAVRVIGMSVAMGICAGMCLGWLAIFSIVEARFAEERQAE